MAPKKSKVKKPKVKKRVAQPAKSIIERTICAHPMLKRVQKEVRELKKKSAKKYHIVSTYFLHGAFKVFSSVVFLFIHEENSSRLKTKRTFVAVVLTSRDRVAPGRNRFDDRSV